MRARLVTLILAAGVSLGGCAYGGGLGGLSVGTGYGNPYGYGAQYGYGSPYGYGAQYGYGSPYGYGGYGYDPFSRYNPYYRSPYYGSPYYGSPYLGWYDGFYYPGHGYYVYDRDGERRRLNEQERKRWVQGIAEMAAATAARNQTGGSTSTQSTSRISADSAVRRSVTGDRSGLAGQIRERSQPRAQVRASERRTTATSVRSPSRSSSLGASLRRRVSTEN